MIGRGALRSIGVAVMTALTLGIVACTGSGVPFHGSGDRAPDAQLSARDRVIHQKLGTFFRRLASHDRFSGAVLLQHGSQVVYRHAFGYADRENRLRNRVTTKFNLGSVDKMFTAVAIMQLVQAGQVALDAPISRYLPDYPKPAGDEITVAELLTHTSGLGDYLQSPGFFSTTSQLLHPQDYFPYIVNEPLLFRPGTRYQYSNSGYIVLGAIVEAVAGEGYFDYLRTHIFDVAGMIHTDFSARPHNASDRATGYTGPAGHRSANASILPIRGGPAGGGYSTVADLVAFADALQAHRLLDEQHTRMLITPRRTVAPGLQEGYGLMSFRPGKVRVIGHNGGAPGVYAYLFIYLGTGYTAAVLSNLDPPTDDSTATSPAIYALVTGGGLR